MSASPSATTTPEPDDDPPGTRSGAFGLSGVASTPTIRKVSVKQGGSLDAALLKKADTFFRRSGRLERMEAAFYRRELLPVGSRSYQIAGLQILGCCTGYGGGDADYAANGDGKCTE